MNLAMICENLIIESVEDLLKNGTNRPRFGCAIEYVLKFAMTLTVQVRLDRFYASEMSNETCANPSSRVNISPREIYWNWFSESRVMGLR